MIMEKPRILIIDDAPMIINMLGNTLKLDYTVIAAKDGEKGIVQAKKYLPALIILDVMMPGMTGFEVLEVLKSDDDTKDIPVILLTGDGSYIAKEKGHSIGAADYIEKPFDMETVKRSVKRYARKPD